MTEAVVWIAGGVGLSIVLRAAALYRGTDRLAFGLVALIGAGLVLGIVELVARVRRAQALSREIAALPKEPTEETVEAASPTLKASLRARIAGSFAPSQPPPFASYLLGLLVMIGLLGTFMGLFESLRGAREALGSSGDVAALRAALGAPMTGLARAFGTSAAGVSSSAMLGLALVAVRRHEAVVFGELAAYATGPLGSLTLARRTLDALEAIARQGASLPVASEAMTRSASALSDVAREVGTALERTTKTIGDDLQKVAQTMRTELKGAGDASARALADAVAPRLEGAVTRVVETTGKQAEATMARLDAASESRIARENEHAKSLQKALESAIAAVTAAQRTESTTLRESVARDAKAILEAMEKSQQVAADAEAARASTFATKMDETATSIAERLRADEVQRVQRLEEAVTTITTRLGENAQASDTRTELLLARLEGVAMGIETTFQKTASHVDESFARTAEQLGVTTKSTLDQLSTSVTATVERLASSVTSTVEQLSSSVTLTSEQLAATTGATADKLASSQAAIVEQLSVSQRATMDELAASARASTAQLAASAQATSAQLADYLQKLSTIREELRADDDARAERVVAETDTRLAKLAAAVGEALASSLDKVVASAQAAPEAAARVIDESAARLRAQAESDAARDASLLEVVARLESLANALESGAQASSERTAAIEARLAETYENTASKWTETLAAQQQSIVDHSDKTVLAVREATESLQKGGAEISSLAELFGASVDRYREASDKWLTGLSTMRAVAERAAQVDAQDLLAAYLEQTREVFDQTVAFQRQLFAELRKTTARTEDAEIVGSSPRLLASGHDAPGEAEE